MTQLTLDGDWDQRPILKDIEEEKFPMIVIWSPPFAREIKRDSCFFFQAEDGIRDGHVTAVQTCALPIFRPSARRTDAGGDHRRADLRWASARPGRKIGRASCTARASLSADAAPLKK